MKKISIILVFCFFWVQSCTTQKIAANENFVDSDLDGVHDSRDACPTVPGSFFNLGCPKDQGLQLSAIYNVEKSTDADLDGVPNEKDDCPLIYGSPFNMGCPFSMDK